METEKISKGPTFSGKRSYVGLALVLFSGMGLFGPPATVIAGAVGLLPGALLFLSLEGLMIDFRNGLIKPYVDFLLFKYGDWRVLDEYETLLLKPESGVDIRDPKQLLEPFSFEVYLMGKNAEPICMKEFREYKTALRFMMEYAVRLKKEPVDYYRATLEKIVERRRREED